MVDPRDPGTMSMLFETRRGRGRPRKIDALTSAQRAANYRARCRQRLAVPHADASVWASLRHENERLTVECSTAHAEIDRMNIVMASLRRDITEKTQVIEEIRLAVKSLTDIMRD